MHYQTFLFRSSDFRHNHDYHFYYNRPYLSTTVCSRFETHALKKIRQSSQLIPLRLRQSKFAYFAQLSI